MFQFFSRNKRILLLLFTILFLVILQISSTSLGMHYYERLDFATGIVTASALNVRAGPGIGYKIISQVYKNEYIRVFAKVGDWYVIQTDNDYIGAVSKDYVKPIYPDNSTAEKTNKIQNNTQDNGLTLDENETFNLVNEQRQAAGLPKLVIDEEVQNVARTKAQDMVNSRIL